MTTELVYNKTGIDAKLAGKANYPAGGTDGQALVKSGTSTAWATVGSGGTGTVTDATTTAKGVVQLAGDLAGTAAAPVLKTIITAGSAGSATTIPVISWNAKGQITAVTPVAAAGGTGGTGTSLPTTTTLSGTSYTLTTGDAGNIVEQNSSGALTITIPANSSAAFPVGTDVEFRLYGTGSIVLTGAAGVTLRSPNNALRLTTQYATASAIKRATDEWIVSGMLVV